MKTALYIEDGLLQVVLTPTGPEETAILKLIESRANIEVLRGSFYECQGGWMRYTGEDRSDSSLMLVLRDTKLKVPTKVLP